MSNMFAIGKVGVEANYEVTLKWKKAPLSPEIEQKLKTASAAAGKKK